MTLRTLLDLTVTLVGYLVYRAYLHFINNIYTLFWSKSSTKYFVPRKEVELFHFKLTGSKEVPKLLTTL